MAELILLDYDMFHARVVLEERIRGILLRQIPIGVAIALVVLVTATVILLLPSIVVVGDDCSFRSVSPDGFQGRRRVLKSVRSGHFDGYDAVGRPSVLLHVLRRRHLE